LGPKRCMTGRRSLSIGEVGFKYGHSHEK
jgi:hypothetical protein